MSETTNQGLSGVAETLLMTLYIRASVPFSLWPKAY
jgi:hypothetical protein